MRRFHVTLAAALAAAALSALAPVAIGGGWAITTIDPIDQALVPGRSVEIGYTIRQHGRAPVDLADTGIEITPPGERSTFSAGRRDGALGHYVATVTVPRPGAQWTARQDWFGPQPLGDLVTASASEASVRRVPPSVPTAVAPRSDGDETPWLLLTATALALAALITQVVWRRPRPALD